MPKKFDFYQISALYNLTKHLGSFYKMQAYIENLENKVRELEIQLVDMKSELDKYKRIIELHNIDTNTGSDKTEFIQNENFMFGE